MTFDGDGPHRPEARSALVALRPGRLEHALDHLVQQLPVEDLDVVTGLHDPVVEALSLAKGLGPLTAESRHGIVAAVVVGGKRPARMLDLSSRRANPHLRLLHVTAPSAHHAAGVSATPGAADLNAARNRARTVA